MTSSHPDRLHRQQLADEVEDLAAAISALTAQLAQQPANTATDTDDPNHDNGDPHAQLAWLQRQHAAAQVFLIEAERSLLANDGEDEDSR